jgi:NADP-dependent 3-hydroxy acid dehydrogenase YdfG
VICPGEIDTPILEKRPTVPDAATRAKMLQPDDVAICVIVAIELPDRAIAEEIVVRPTAAR